ncbi:RNA polymerase factor sigma-54 [Campylobacter curvus]|uniref:RNA polymerase factor sigma-54 n=1 Tax=Campylobacter curvus TaxID=200 RepID=UPI00037405E0|nr:RNA polymerase factor sigma-54 [Campylobacter curvus]QKF61313.1 RNA polymerase sigma54 factor [Campylobacter curvus]UEB49626.1 RNA polymerase factor sigma-54 [Campylobacter curvus]
MLRQKEALAPKNKLNHTLRSWLPILQSGLDELKETLEPFAASNPFVRIEHKNLADGADTMPAKKRNFFAEFSKNSVSEAIEATSIYKQSLHEKLEEQINPPLFPTQKSQLIAYKIIECLSDEGYFEYDDEILKGFSLDEIERVRARFAYLEPAGVGARDYKESFLFQLDESGASGEIYECAKKIICEFENIQNLTKLKFYEPALKIIKKFKNPPAIEYLQDEPPLTPDIFIDTNESGISVRVNDAFYPQVVLDIEGQSQNDEFISAKVREARELVDALEMRKSTLYKIGLMIVEYQYDYFFGGDIKPMKLKDIAGDLGRNPSTISRAIANKYLECSRGTIALKSFFAAALDEETSNTAIKDFLLELINKENPAKPLSDLKILDLIQAKFNITIVRRTITKYRKTLNIASSSERKKIYQIQG